MQDIKNFNLQELKDALTKCKVPAFHGQQIFSWIYKKGADSFAQMSDLSADLRKKLSAQFSLGCLGLRESFKSLDGTEKFLLALKDDNLIEAVVIPANDRTTGCISTQVGCKFKCNFCASGERGFKRNLSVAEIIEQVLFLKKHCQQKSLTHLVFMGIGEPMDNYDNVLKAIRIINSPLGLNIGSRRLTISTCGIIPGIKKLAQEKLQVELSISLHSADERLREKIMPINKIYPLKDLIPACKEYIIETKRQVTFEYILMRGVNSDLQSAQDLCRMLVGLKLCKVNLIPFNASGEFKVEPPNKLEVLFFKDYLTKHKISVTLRRPRGQDIEAACGQLRLRYGR